jgi:hypothetical protein
LERYGNIPEELGEKWKAVEKDEILLGHRQSERMRNKSVDDLDLKIFEKKGPQNEHDSENICFSYDSILNTYSKMICSVHVMD